jgi:hypothetical protein
MKKTINIPSILIKFCEFWKTSNKFISILIKNNAVDFDCFKRTMFRILGQQQRVVQFIYIDNTIKSHCIFEVGSFVLADAVYGFTRYWTYMLF